MLPTILLIVHRLEFVVLLKLSLINLASRLPDPSNKLSIFQKKVITNNKMMDKKTSITSPKKMNTTRSQSSLRLNIFKNITKY